MTSRHKEESVCVCVCVHAPVTSAVCLHTSCVWGTSFLDKQCVCVPACVRVCVSGKDVREMSDMKVGMKKCLVWRFPGVMSLSALWTLHCWASECILTPLSLPRAQSSSRKLLHNDNRPWHNGFNGCKYTRTLALSHVLMHTCTHRYTHAHSSWPERWGQGLCLCCR